MKRIKSMISLLFALMMLSSVIMIYPVTAGAQEAFDNSTYYEQQLAKYQKMKERTIPFKYSQAGIYTVKSVKLYVREVTGVNEDGSFIIGPWTIKINEGSIAVKEITLPGTCVMFAFGFDILWGTDWPYSDVFWSDINTPVNKIYIESCGICRMASLKIKVNDCTIFDDWNLPSHSEWTP